MPALHLRSRRRRLTDDLVAKRDAVVADEHTGAGDQPPNLILCLAAERAPHLNALASHCVQYVAKRLRNWRQY